MKTKYQVQDHVPRNTMRIQWETCTKASTYYMKDGWLHYELADGTIGLARPGTWRVKPETPKKYGRNFSPLKGYAQE